jgi:transcriptional regulator with XRE-family HTH domain
MQDGEKAGERLRRARKEAKLSVEAVAKRSGYSVSGIRAIENGQNGLRPDAAETFAPILGTTPGYLLTGEGPDRVGERLVPILGHVGADSEGTIIYATGQETGDLVPIPPGGGELSRGLEVRGHSGGDFAPQGSIIYFDDQRNPPTPDMIGYPCVVATDDDRVLLKRLLKGSRQGLYDLESIAGPTLSDMRLRWAALVTFVAPPHQARKIRRQAGVRQVA